MEIAYEKENLKIFDSLIEKEADPNTKFHKTEIKLLYDASFKNKIEFAKLLVYHDAELNTRETKQDNFTALYAAIQQGNEEIVFLLCDNEADTNIKDDSGVTPLELAYHNGNINIIRKLLEKDANPNNIISNNKETTIFH